MEFTNIFTEKKDIDSIIKASEISTDILREVIISVAPGISSNDIDNLALSLCKKNKVSPAFLGVKGVKQPFPSSICVSINHEILHAIPHKNKIIMEGDVVKLDFGIIYQGFYTDHCITIGVGNISEEKQRLINTARLCVETAAKNAIVGNKVGDISFALQTVAELNNYDFVTSYCGHGIGRSLHEPPEIPSWGAKNTGIELQKGMVLCIENQITLGDAELILQEDGWSLESKDKSVGAMFEQMVMVEENAPRYLTFF